MAAGGSLHARVETHAESSGAGAGASPGAAAAPDQQDGNATVLVINKPAVAHAWALMQALAQAQAFGSAP